MADNGAVTPVPNGSASRKYVFPGGFRVLGMAAYDVMFGIQSMTTLKVFLAMTKHMESGNRVAVNQTALAAMLGTSQPHVSRAIKDLITDGVLLEDGRAGLVKIYKLHPALAWNGSAKAHQIACAQAYKSRVKRARIKGVIDGGKE